VTCQQPFYLQIYAYKMKWITLAATHLSGAEAASESRNFRLEAGGLDHEPRN
jgi:hypothetical protein